MENIVEIKCLTKKFNEKEVFANLNLVFPKNKIVGILGESGSGKTTLLNIIGLIENETSGEVIINGRKNPKINSRQSEKVLREQITFLFQNFALIDDQTVLYNLEIALKFVKKTSSEKHALIKKTLKSVGLEGYERNKIYELSGGEQQRIALARALLKPSQLILADEPTGSLDDKNKKNVMSLLLQLKEKGKSVIVVTHDKELADFCDMTYYL